MIQVSLAMFTERVSNFRRASGVLHLRDRRASFIRRIKIPDQKCAGVSRVLKLRSMF